MSIPSDPAKVSPKDARLGFRNHSLEGVSCAQLSAGYLQANIACVPSNMADDFEEFCRLNSSPCPLLYRSKPGEVSAAPLAENSDIRYEVKGAPSNTFCPYHSPRPENVTGFGKYIYIYIFFFQKLIIDAQIFEKSVQKYFFIKVARNSL